MRLMNLCRAVSIATLLGGAGLAHADQYTLSLTPASSFSGTAGLTINFGGSFKGNYDQVTNAAGTRTINGIFGGSTAAPNNQSITIGNSSATGSGSPNTSPRGTMVVRFNSFSRTVELLGVNVNALGPSTPPTIAATATLALPSFRTFAPNYTYPLFGIPFSVPLGNATITALAISQDGSAVTTGTPRTGGGVDFTVNVPVRVTGSVEFQGTITPLDIPQVLIVTGFLAPNGATATSGATFSLNVTQPVAPFTGDPLVPTPFALPAPSTAVPPPPPANVLLVLNITGGNATLAGNGNFPSSGPATTIADVASANQVRRADGLKTADDIIVFLGGFFAGDPLADVASANQAPTPDGVYTADDIIVFLGAYFQ